MKINLERAKHAAASDTAIEIARAIVAGEPIDDVIGGQVMDHAIAKYRPHIAAALRKHNIDIGDEDTLDADKLMQIVNDKSGLTIDGWSKDSIFAAVDKLLSAQLSKRLGFEVASVQDVDAVKQAMIDFAAEAITSGRATAFISKQLVKKFQKEKAFQEAGIVEEVDKKRLMARMYQKRYRRRNREVWDTSGSGGGGGGGLPYPSGPKH